MPGIRLDTPEGAASPQEPAGRLRSRRCL